MSAAVGLDDISSTSVTNNDQPQSEVKADITEDVIIEAIEPSAPPKVRAMQERDVFIY